MKAGRLACVALCVMLAQCAAPLTRFYPGSYFAEDRTYVNKPLGFSLVFTGNWNITCDPAAMKGPGKSLAASLARSGAELLLMGSTVEGTQGVRAIAINLNAENRAYAEKIRQLNINDLQSDAGFADFSAASLPCITWRYTISNYEFVEYFFKLNTYNLRLAFWAKPELFANFLPVYNAIAASLVHEDQ